MIKKLLLSVIAAMLLTVQSAAAATRGDVNNDGECTVSDVMMTVNYIKGITSEGFIIERADLNGDKEITISDVMILVDIVLNGIEKDTVFDVESEGTGIGYGGPGNGGDIGGAARMPRK